MTQLFTSKVIRAIFIACSFFVPVHSVAQTLPVKKLLFETITINDGLSQGMVNSILQDHYGFMWFATKDGLNRYDGYHFIVYRHDPSNSASIADNYVEGIFEDSKGRLWAGTTSQGLELFDRETETFRHFKKAGKDNTIEIGHVFSVAGDKEGQIWIASGKGVMVLTEHPDAKGKASTFTFRRINDDPHPQVFIAQNGTVWISGSHGNLLTISKNKTGKEEIDSILSSKYLPYQANGAFAEHVVNCFQEDTSRHCLFLFTDHCISRFDEKQNTFNTICLRTTAILSACSNGKTIWLIDYFHLTQFNTSTAELTRIESTDPGIFDLTTSANCTYTDKSGIVWIGTAGYGILKYNPRAEKFHHTDTKTIHWIKETNDGHIVVVKDEPRLYIFDKNTGSYTGMIPDEKLQKNELFNGMVLDAALQDDDGSYWICKQTLLRYDATKKNYTAYRDKAAFPLYKDRRGEIWFGSNEAFCNYNKTGKFANYKYPVATANFPYKFLQAIYEDDKGIFWLGTISGLLRFDPLNNSWRIFKNDPADSTSLSFDLIFCLCPDPLGPDKYLWIGTNGGGLNCFDMRTGKVRRNDGLQGNEFNRYAFCKTRDGTLFFGGVNGFNYFDPAEIEDNATVPNVMITGLKITNQMVSFQSKNSPLSKPVYLTDKIVLPYRDNMISFDFAALDFANPGKNLYKYKLEGFNKDWIDLATEHSATYTNLDPGTYTLKIKGSNSDGVWNENGASLQLVILPPWYMTWWFRIAAAIAAIAMLYAFYRYRLQQALKVQAIRNRIAQDLHDEIGSNLSNISIFTEVAQEKFAEPASVQSLLKKISDSTQTSQEAMSDIVWMINTRNDRFENIIIRMRALAAELFEAKHQQLNMDLDERLNDVKLGMEERKNFYLIYKEALNNIVKYACCKNVWIEMKMQDAAINLKIKDDGKGFDLEKHYHGNGLNNMKRRAELLKGSLFIHSEPGIGTSVELNFPV